ncbi:hypothetical protein BpHYR1_023313 [Brachionus plicatilis]|uniref:Uncharacterized protein n=1 Tax=Brachionus plicatilis TaxID=10195 RepID=A0A3M7RP23_BRAPC|nr:hypothetical protein BpHYR1_023313 [Brachionus plicatilis]
MFCCCELIANLFRSSKQEPINQPANKESFINNFIDYSAEKSKKKSQNGYSFSKNDTYQIYDGHFNPRTDVFDDSFKCENQKNLEEINPEIFTVYPGNFVYRLSPGAMEALASHLNKYSQTEAFNSFTARSKQSSNDYSSEASYYPTLSHGIPFQVVFNQNASF